MEVFQFRSISVLTGVALAANACAQPSTQVASRELGQSPTTQPTAADQPVSSGDPAIDKILDRLETKGRAIKGLSCELRYQYVTVMPVEDRKKKEGTLLFARVEPNGRFLVHFNKLEAAGVVEKNSEYFLFDGAWLTVRNDVSKSVTKTQIARPAEKMDPFAIGRGPFPLPFGQKRDEILRLFRVSLVPFALGDPDGTQHLRCIPRPRTELAEKYNYVDLFVDKTLDLPVRLVTESARDDNRIEVDFKAIDADAAPAGARFQVSVPSDFNVTVQPLEDGTPVRLDRVGDQ